MITPGQMLLRGLRRSSSLLNRFCLWLAGAFLVTMLVLVLIQVVARYLFQAPPYWTEEAARYCMIWAGLLGATVAFHEKLDPVMVRVDNVKGPWKRTLLQFIRAAAVVIFLGPVLYHGVPLVARHVNRLTETLEISSAYVVAIVPIAALIILFHLGVQIVGGGLESEHEPDT